jgi:hypothetical protein
VANIGDINGDGNDDIAIGAPSSWSFNDSGKVYIFHSGDPIDTIPDTVLTSNHLDYNFGSMIINAGDINNDGIEDFCFGIGRKIFIHLGYQNIHDPTILTGYSIGAGGDINNDGFDDLIIGRDRSIHVYYGTANFDATENLTIRIQASDSLTGFSSDISIAGDMNADGFDNIIALAPNWPNTDHPQGKVYFYSYANINNIRDGDSNSPDNFELFQNYPNPFNPTTTIKYSLPSTCYIKLKIYDLLGREIETLIDGIQREGIHTVLFNSSNLSSGIYYYRLMTETSVLQRPMTHIK